MTFSNLVIFGKWRPLSNTGYVCQSSDLDIKDCIPDLENLYCRWPCIKRIDHWWDHDILGLYHKYITEGEKIPSKRALFCTLLVLGDSYVLCITVPSCKRTHIPISLIVHIKSQYLVRPIRVDDCDCIIAITASQCCVNSLPTIMPTHQAFLPLTFYRVLTSNWHRQDFPLPTHFLSLIRNNSSERWGEVGRENINQPGGQ